MSTALKTASAGVLDAREVLASWLSRQIEALKTIVELETQSGEAFLDDPEAASRVPGRLRELRDQEAVARSAVAAQEVRVREAEAYWLKMYAAQLQVGADAATQSLNVHNAKTAKLLAALEEHDGSYVTRAALEAARPSDFRLFNAVDSNWKRPVSESLAEKVEAAEKFVWTVEQMSAGMDLSDTSCLPSPDYVVAYPDLASGPGALVPSVSSLRWHEHSPEDAHTSLQVIYDLQAQVADLDQDTGR